MKLFTSFTQVTHGKKCPICDDMFHCEGSTICWWSSEQKIDASKIQLDYDCICKKCLLKRYEKKFEINRIKFWVKS